MHRQRRDLLKLAGGVLLAGPALLAACGRTPGSTADSTAPATAGDRLFIETGAGLLLLSGERRPITVAGEATVAGADWATLYASRIDGKETQLTTYAAATGQPVATMKVPGHWRVRLVAPSGRRLLLAPPEAAGATPYTPSGREHTDWLLVDPSGAQPSQRLALAGNYEPEAFASDEGRLFVLQYLPAKAPERYRVRICTLASGTVGPLLAQKSLLPVTAEEEMQGQGRQAVLAPDRSRLYTLYTHQPDHQHTRDLLAGGRAAGRAAVHAFVHVLSLQEGWAYCLDLPAPFGHGPAAAHTLALTPNGRRLFVTDWTSSQLVEADALRLTIDRQQTLDDLVPLTGGTASQVTPDGQTLVVGGGTALVTIDTTQFKVERRWALGAPLRGLAISPDGQRLYLGQPAAVQVMRWTTGEPLAPLVAPGLASLRHVSAP